MDLNSKNFGRVITDFNKLSEKKAQKKENVLLSFTVKAISRDQEKNFLISRLQREIRKNLETLNLLQIQNDIKEDLLNSKDKELKSLITENKKLQKLLEQNQKNVLNVSTENKSLIIMTDTYNNNNNNNNECSINSNNIDTLSDKNTFDSKSNSEVSMSTTSHIDSIKLKTSKKRSFKRVKETNATNFIYNFRKRNIQK